MTTEAQNHANLRNAPKSTAPRTNRLSSPTCQQRTTNYEQRTNTNKPNFRKAKMKLNFYLKNEFVFKLQENKPNQTQLVTA